jgi:hypothetical protein
LNEKEKKELNKKYLSLVDEIDIKNKKINQLQTLYDEKEKSFKNLKEEK